MEIKPIRRPWQKQVNQGTRYNPDPFYQSSEWKRIRENHINGSTALLDGMILSNKYCVQCWKESKKFVPMHTVDHVERMRAGGSKSYQANLQSLCVRHHAQKSANESNEAQKQRK